MWSHSRIKLPALQEYVCLCEGPSLGPVGSEGVIDSPLLTKEVDGASRSEVSDLGREAVTKYSVIARYHPPTQSNWEVFLLAIQLKTGRTHQIRVHMASIDCPLAGDMTYGRKDKSVVLQCPQLFLHCRRICLLDIEDALFSAEADLPQDLASFLATLDPIS